MSTTYPQTLPVSTAGSAVSGDKTRSIWSSITDFAKRAGAAYMEHQRRRAQRILLPYLALQPDKTLADLGYSPELIKEIRYAYRNRA